MLIDRSSKLVLEYRRLVLSPTKLMPFPLSPPTHPTSPSTRSPPSPAQNLGILLALKVVVSRMANIGTTPNRRWESPLFNTAIVFAEEFFVCFFAANAANLTGAFAGILVVRVSKDMVHALRLHIDLRRWCCSRGFRPAVIVREVERQASYNIMQSLVEVVCVATLVVGVLCEYLLGDKILQFVNPGGNANTNTAFPLITGSWNQECADGSGEYSRIVAILRVAAGFAMAELVSYAGSTLIRDWRLVRLDNAAAAFYAREIRADSHKRRRNTEYSENPCSINNDEENESENRRKKPMTQQSSRWASRKQRLMQMLKPGGTSSVPAPEAGEDAILTREVELKEQQMRTPSGQVGVLLTGSGGDRGESMPRLKAPTPISVLTKVSRFQQFFYVVTSLAVVTDSLVALSYTAAADKEKCVPLHLCNPRLDDVYRNQTDRC